MARTALTVNAVVETGTTLSATSANADGHSLVNTARANQLFLYVNNGGGSSINVTIQTPGTVRGLAIADQVVAVGAGAIKLIGPFDPSFYNQAAGTVYVDFSSVTSVTVAAFKI